MITRRFTVLGSYVRFPMISIKRNGTGTDFANKAYQQFVTFSSDVCCFTG